MLSGSGITNGNFLYFFDIAAYNAPYTVYVVCSHIPYIWDYLYMIHLFYRCIYFIAYLHTIFLRNILGITTFLFYLKLRIEP